MIRKSNIIASAILATYLAVVAYCCFGHFSDLPSISKCFLGIPADKIVHFLMFFPFPILCYLSFNRHTVNPWRSVLQVSMALVAGGILAAATEIGQSFTDYRSGDIMDFCADLISLATASALTLAVAHIKIRKARISN